jgi:hypothetical protein
LIGYCTNREKTSRAYLCGDKYDEGDGDDENDGATEVDTSCIDVLTHHKDPQTWAGKAKLIALVPAGSTLQRQECPFGDPVQNVLDREVSGNSPTLENDEVNDSWSSSWSDNSMAEASNEDPEVETTLSGSLKSVR